MSEEGADVGAALQGGHDAAVERMGRESQEPASANNQDGTGAQGAEGQTPEQAQAPAQPTEPAAPSAAYTYTDPQGNQVPLTKEVLDHFVSTMLNVYQQMGDRQAMPQRATHAQPSQPEQAPEIPADAKKMLDPYLEYFFKQKMGTYEPKFQQMDEMMVDFQANRMLHDASSAIEKETTLKEIMANPKHAQTVKGLVMFMRGQFGMNYDQASKHVGTMLKEIIEGNKANYIKQKVRTAATKMEGAGGAIPAPGGKQMSVKDWHSGNLLERAMGKLKSAFAEGT